MRDLIGTFKRDAVMALDGKFINSALLMLVAGAVHFSFAAISRGALTILLLPMFWGVTVAFLAVARGSDVDLGWITKGYSRFGDIFLTLLLRNIYIALWSLLLFVPGIVKSYSYSQTEFILHDNPDCKYDEAICRSMALMNGHKMDLFLLDLSFIGWAILCVLTCGIGFLFLFPYWYTTRAKFYEELVARESGTGTAFV